MGADNGDSVFVHAHRTSAAVPDDVCVVTLTSHRTSDPATEGDGHVWRLGFRALQ